MRLVPNQRVPSSGCNTLNSTTPSDSSGKTVFPTDRLCHSAVEEYMKAGRKEGISILIFTLFSTLPRLLFCIFTLTKYNFRVLVRINAQAKILSSDINHDSSRAALLRTK